MRETASSNHTGALLENITQTYDHIFTLVPFCESEDYSEEAKSAFRKTVMIHTASIVEAMLYYFLVTSFSDDDVAEYYSYWKLSDKRVLYKIDEKHEIVGGHYVKYPGKTNTEKMNLGQINDFLYRNEAISRKLRDKIDYVRTIRNDQHISTHKKVKSYSKADMERAFAVLFEVSKLVSNKQGIIKT